MGGCQIFIDKASGKLAGPNSVPLQMNSHVNRLPHRHLASIPAEPSIKRPATPDNDVGCDAVPFRNSRPSVPSRKAWELQRWDENHVPNRVPNSAILTASQPTHANSERPEYMQKGLQTRDL